MSSYAAAVTPPGRIAPSLDRKGLPLMPVVSGRGKRVLRVRAATFPRRLAAALIDFSLVTLFSMGVSALAALFLGIQLPTAKEFGPDYVLAGVFDRNPLVMGTLGIFIGIFTLYQAYLGGILGQTFGKRLMRLRVITNQGQTPGPVVAVLRSLLLPLSLAPAGLGFFWCLFDRERRALHDHLARTYVILDEP